MQHLSNTVTANCLHAKQHESAGAGPFCEIQASIMCIMDALYASSEQQMFRIMTAKYTQSNMGLQRLGCSFAHNQKSPLRPNSEPKLDSPYTSSVLTLMKRLILP